MSQKQYAISCYPWFTKRGRIMDSKGNALADVRYAANQVAPGNIPAMAAAPEMLEALRVIAIALREPAGGEYFSARKFLDERDIFNGDLQGERVLLRVAEAAINAAMGEQSGK